MRTFVFRLSLVLIFMMPWEGLVEFGLGTALKLVGIVLAICWAATVVMTGRMRRPTSFFAVTFAFVLWVAMSVLWSADPGRSIGHVATWAQSLVLVVILLDLYRTRASILSGLQAFILGAYVAVIGAVSNYFAGTPFYSHYDRFSPGETNPDGFGFIIALGVPVAWYLAISAGTGRFRPLLRIVNYVYIPAAFLGLALSGTRTATVAALAGMAFGLVALRRLRMATRVAVVVVVALGIYLLLPVVQPLRSFERLGTTATEATEGTWNGRLLNWAQGLETFSEHPVAGVGAYMYPSVNVLGKAAHNTFLAVLVELGVIGFVLFMGILTIVVGHAFTLPPWERGFWLTVLLVWTIGSTTLTWGHRTTTWLFLTFLVASSMAIRQGEHRMAGRRTARAVPIHAGAGR
jgi:O-antigen ligase